MDKTYEGFCDFVDDCVVDEDLLYDLSRDKSLELLPSERISEMRQEEGEPKTCLVSLKDEPKVA
tara:strand:- start:244 stop:435 length:192 start_codon:yes stop_codon:yes gene_type:complete